MRLMTAGFLSVLISLGLHAADALQKPGPEQKKLEMNVGTWEGETVAVQTPLERAGKSTARQEARMILGGFFLEVRGEITRPEGTLSFLQVLAWDSDKSRFTESWFTNAGDFPKSGKDEPATCTIDGNTWKWSWDEEKDGKTYKCRQVAVFADDLRSVKTVDTYSEDGIHWKPRSEGKMVKTSK